MESFVIIVAGGTGQRMESAVPKQLMIVAGKPILMHTISRFHDVSGNRKIVLVLHPTLEKLWSSSCEQFQFDIPHDMILGGDTRFHSVQNGLQWIFTQYQMKDETLIAIHDGVRPLVARATIEIAFKTAQQERTAIPVVKSRDSLRIQDTPSTSRAMNRNAVWMVQTPQVFQASLLKEAYSHPYHTDFTDDASVVEYAGYPIHLCDGDIQNIKITYPVDLLIAEALLRQLEN